MRNTIEFSDLVNQCFISVTKGDGEVIFRSPFKEYRLSGVGDYNSNIWIESINGDLSDLEDAEIHQANHYREQLNHPNRELYMMNMFSIKTHKGYVDIRFEGSSNGYYGVDADLVLSVNNPTEVDDFVALSWLLTNKEIISVKRYSNHIGIQTDLYYYAIYATPEDSDIIHDEVEREPEYEYYADDGYSHVIRMNGYVISLDKKATIEYGHRVGQ